MHHRPVQRLAFESLLVALFLLLQSAPCEATVLNVFASHSNQDTTTLTTGAPSPTPWNRDPDVGSDGNTQSSTGESSRLGAGNLGNNGIDFLVAAFFLIAAGWLVLALIYSILVLIVVRLRARGQLDVYDDNFGRLYLLGTRCYIPFGCVLRRYVIAMTRERNRDGSVATVRLMSRDERRLAMERLLDNHEKDRDDSVHVPKEKDAEASESKVHESKTDGSEDVSVLGNEAAELGIEDGNVMDEVSEGEPVCTICLNEYEPTDRCYTSACSHRYHRECLLDWLQRRANTECPCCRTPLVSDAEVWETVQEMREERRRQLQKANRGRGIFSRFRRGRGGAEQSLPGDEDTVEATPPSSPTARTSFDSVGTQSEDIVQSSLIVENFEDTRDEP